MCHVVLLLLCDNVCVQKQNPLIYIQSLNRTETTKKQHVHVRNYKKIVICNPSISLEEIEGFNAL